MGHERIGVLPKTKRWRTIVGELATADLSSSATAEIAAHTLDALGSRYRELATDESVFKAFSYFVDIARLASQDEAATSVATKTPLALVAELTKRLSETSGSLETRELVQRAAADALAIWHREATSQQGELFETDPHITAWKNLGTGAGFCELSRLYFSRLTERYLNYFLDRESSACLPNLASRENFQRQLREHVADVSRLSFESAKITQSYAAGWFNKYSTTCAPSAIQKKKFLSYAFDKLRAEFRREGGQK